jgi:hypothetical protein
MSPKTDFETVPKIISPINMMPLNTPQESLPPQMNLNVKVGARAVTREIKNDLRSIDAFWNPNEPNRVHMRTASQDMRIKTPR